MRIPLTIILIMLLLIAGCDSTPQISVKLSSPADGSMVPSQSPVLIWGSGGGASVFRLLVASDINFQNVVIDASNLGEPRYIIPPGKLNTHTAYYWKVLANRGNSTSEWSATWSFQTASGESPGKRGNIRVSATLDGVPWSGPVNYAISGPFSDSDNSLPWTFNDLPMGTYTVTYNYGGPAGARLASVTPSPSQDLQGGGTTYFILNFNKQFTSNIVVNATLNGLPWSGAVNYSLSGSANPTGQVVPQSFGNLSAGIYTVSYNSGGPPGAILSGISPSASQTLHANGSLSYTFNFSTQQTVGNIVVRATLNGAQWSGAVNFLLSGPWQTSDIALPRTYTNIPAGGYNFNYVSGGPPGATLSGISPAPSQMLAGGRTIQFNLNFITSQPSTGTISVNALLDGQPWRVAIGSGSITYSLTGPGSETGNTVPASFGDMPTGQYTLTYRGGGPIGATLTNISPSPLQNLMPGGNIAFTLNFTGLPKGTILVNAMLNGQPWSGHVSYSVHGPYVESGNSIPWSFSGAPSGSYSIQYSAGGPPGAVYEGVSPPSLILLSGGTGSFTIMFKFQGIKPEPKPAPVPGPLLK